MDERSLLGLVATWILSSVFGVLAGYPVMIYRIKRLEAEIKEKQNKEKCEDLRKLCAPQHHKLEGMEDDLEYCLGCIDKYIENCDERLRRRT